MFRSLPAVFSTIGGLACALILILTGIVATASPRVPADLGWLIDSGCAFPCWRGITPGQTRFLDASRTLREQPDVTVTASDNGSGYNFLSLSFLIRTPRGALRGEMASSDNIAIVSYIYFYALNDTGDGWLSLAELITLRGAPEAVMRDTKSGSMVRFNFGKRGFEALNFPWSMYAANSRTCPRWSAAVGLYLGDDPNFEAWDRWRGFDAQFDGWCP
jgi:hypothetical protein